MAQQRCGVRDRAHLFVPGPNTYSSCAGDGLSQGAVDEGGVAEPTAQCPFQATDGVEVLGAPEGPARAVRSGRIGKSDGQAVRG